MNARKNTVLSTIIPRENTECQLVGLFPLVSGEDGAPLAPLLFCPQVPAESHGLLSGLEDTRLSCLQDTSYEVSCTEACCGRA